MSVDESNSVFSNYPHIFHIKIHLRKKISWSHFLCDFDKEKIQLDLDFYAASYSYFPIKKDNRSTLLVL